MTSTRPFLSVITPSLNQVSLLRDCVRHLQAGAPDIEHIVIDGGSEDGSAEFLASTGLPFVSEPDRGQSHAINKGIGLARADVVTWLNADDRFVPGALSLVRDTFASREPAEWAYGRGYVVNMSSDSRRVAGPRSRLKRRHLALGNRLIQPATFFRRSAFLQVGGLAEDLHLAMDLDLWLKFLNERFPSRLIDSELAIFLVHPGSKTGRIRPSSFYLEECIAYSRAGWTRSAELSAARAAAWEALDGDSMVRHQDLARSVEEVLSAPQIRALQLDPVTVRRCAGAEAAHAEMEAGKRRANPLRHLLKPQPWGARLGLMRSLSAIRRAAIPH